MSLDVSIYKIRVESGYLSTVASGTARPVGASPFSTATSGAGGTSGVVRTTGTQIVGGRKLFRDRNITFEYDISVGDRVVEQSSFLVREASLGSGFSWTSDGSLVVSSIEFLDDIEDVSTGGKAVNQVLTWKGTYWEADDVSAAGSVSYTYVDGSLAARDILIQGNIDDITTINAYQDIQDVSIALALTSNAYDAIQDASIALNTTNISAIDTSIAYLDSSLNWLYGNAPYAFNELNDVSIVSVEDQDGVLYEASTATWKNAHSYNITDGFYTKYEVDQLIADISGGFYG